MKAHVWILVAALALSAIVLGTATGAVAADGPTTVTYTYDGAGRLVEVVYGDGTTLAYTYDAAGNLLARTVTRGFEIYLPLVVRDYAG